MLKEMGQSNPSFLLEELAFLRKEAPAEILDIYKSKTQKLIQTLKKVEVHIQNENEHFQIPNELIEKFKTVRQQEEWMTNFIPKIYEQTQLMNILIKKKSCQISKIIDEI